MIKINTNALPRSKESVILVEFKNGEWHSCHDYIIHANGTTAWGSYEGYITTRETKKFLNREKRKVISTIKKLKTIEKKLGVTIKKLREPK